jgi:hypothetical protein
VFGAKKTRVVFETVPKGAAIEIDGKAAGTATDGTLTVPDLEIGHAYPVTARLDGYEPKQQVFEPHGGDHVTIALAELAPKVDLDSRPTGASIEIDGKAVGTTPVAITTLPAGKSVALVLKKPGYHDLATTLDVPGPGKELRIIEPLVVAEDLARVRIESEPPGAQVVQNGQVLAGVVTPAEVLVEAGKPQRFVLTMPHRVPALIEPFVPARGSDGIVKTAKLATGADLRIETNIDGKVAITNAPHCKDLATPVTCVLAPGSYVVELTGAPSAHATRTVAVGNTDVVVHFDFGYVQAAAGKHLRVGGAVVPRAAFEVGTRSVTVGDDSGTHATTVRVTAGATVIAE